MSSTVLITGVAGFIGFHVAQRLLSQGRAVVGIDNLDPYYDVQLKKARLGLLDGQPGFRFLYGDLVHEHAFHSLVEIAKPQTVLHLAAQAGIRHSLDAPRDFVSANLDGFFNVIDACRSAHVEHLVYASSSSVYGADPIPFTEDARADRPLNLYAATKRANELMAHAYGHLHGYACTGLRLFTVYGPWGRPDMALFKFADRILRGEPIQVYNRGDMQRDFTYIDDVVDAIVALIDQPQGLRVFNVGNAEPVGLMDMIGALERALGRTAVKEMLPMQPGDAPATWADTTRLQQATGLVPQTSIDQGIGRFVDWYRGYYPERF